MTRRFTIAALHRVAVMRPDGYVEDVLSRGTVTGQTVSMSDEDYAALAAKYRDVRPPSFAQKVKNFAASAINHLASGMPMASDEEVIRRHDICLGCEFYKGNSCQKCGCPVNRQKQFISKLSWANERCPIGKWGKVDTDS